jgi:hypothetical protein
MNEIKYVVKVNGEEVSPRVDTIGLAENYVKQLNPNHQSIAEVVQVTLTGKQVLFG